jgi:hypothetical protein
LFSTIASQSRDCEAIVENNSGRCESRNSEARVEGNSGLCE